MKKLLLSLLFLCVAIPSLAQSGDDTGGTVVEGTPSGGSSSGLCTGSGPCTLTNPLLLSEDPAANAEAVTLHYLNLVLGPINSNLSNALLVTGGTMSGTLTLSDSSPAASQAYVAAHSGAGAFNGGPITNPLVLPSDPTTNLQAATKQYVDAHAAAWLAGGTLTGNLTLHADPTSALQAATKQYVDAHASTPTLSGLNGLYSSTAYTSGTVTLISTSFNEGTAGTTLTGTHPATNVPGNAWTAWPSSIAALTYKSGGGATGAGSVNQANIINTGVSNYTITYSGLTNTATSLVVFRFASAGEYLSVWMLGSGGVSLEEAVGGVTTVIGNDTIANGATGSIVVTVSGNSVTATPFGGAPLTYTIPSGHADATGQFVGYFASTGTGFTLGGLTVATTGYSSSSVSCVGFLNADGTCTTPGSNTIAGMDGSGHLAAMPEIVTTTSTPFLGVPTTTIVCQEDHSAGIYDPRCPRYAGGIYGSTPAAAAQAMSNQMACDLSTGVVRQATARWPQGIFPVDNLLIAPGSHWIGSMGSEGGTQLYTNINNHGAAFMVGSMTVTCADGQSHTDSNGGTIVQHLTFSGCSTGGCTNAPGDIGTYATGGPNNTGLENGSQAGKMENVFAENFGGYGLRVDGVDTKAFHNRVYATDNWYYYGGYKGVTESATGPEFSATTTGTTSSVALSWPAVSGAAGYIVYRGTTSGAENEWLNVGSPTFTDTAAPGTAGWVSGSIQNVVTNSLATPTVGTTTPSTTGGSLPAHTYYYRVTAYQNDIWHGAAEFYGGDPMVDGLEAYGLFDAPNVYNYHHLADIIIGGGYGHFDHLWPQLGQVGIYSPVTTGGSGNIENVRVDFARLEGMVIKGDHISVRGGQFDGNCTSPNAATINTGQEGSSFAGQCNQLWAINGAFSVDNVWFTDNGGFGATQKTADYYVETGINDHVSNMHGAIPQYVTSRGILSGSKWDWNDDFSHNVTVDAHASYNIQGMHYVNPADTTPQTVWAFDNLTIGQEFYVLGGNSNVTLKDSSTGGYMSLCAHSNVNLGSVTGALHFTVKYTLGGNLNWAFVTEVCPSTTVTGAPNILASSETVTFSATPTFSTSTRSSIITMTGNIASFTLAAGADGQEKTLIFCQDGTGGRSVTPPSNVHGFMAEGTTASKCSAQHYTYSVGQTAWLSDGPGTINE